ncbi:MAG: competence protein ComEA [Chloroflexi bacterium HGW-Chloroflexi-1]|nr:MAG: competence protein ComEA [Chloroflexi bacterium HGW-Chloroflexi-1]
MDAPGGARNVRGYIGLSLVWLAILGSVLWLTRRPSAQPIEILPPPTALPTATPAASPTPSPLRVDVAGAVRAPGVYTLPPWSIVADAIAAAGGPAEDAALDRINKAVALQDGAQVYVPHVAESAPPPPVNPAPQAPASAPATAGTGPVVNINTATAAELDTLPGIGPAMAQRIIEGRPYGAIEEIMRVKGIGQATFDKLKDCITVQ